MSHSVFDPTLLVEEVFIKIRDKKIKKFHSNESGIALIVVLSFVLLMSAIISLIVAISQKSAVDTAVISDMGESRYLAEGALTRLYWLMIANKQTNPNSGGNTSQFNNSAAVGNGSQVDYSADGHTLNINYYNAKVSAKIYDMCSGFDVSYSSAATSFQPLLQYYNMYTNLGPDFQSFLNNLSSYAVPNINNGMMPMSGSNNLGLTSPGYTALGEYPLPRGDYMEYREEILWIPPSGEFIKPNSDGLISSVNIIPPNGMYFQSSGKPSFFTASEAMIMQLCNFSKQQADTIISERAQWLQNTSNSIYNYIDTESLMVITQKFSLQDSGYYTLVITASHSGGSFPATIIASMQIMGNSIGNSVQYYQYMVY